MENEVVDVVVRLRDLNDEVRVRCDHGWIDLWNLIEQSHLNVASKQRKSK